MCGGGCVGVVGFLGGGYRGFDFDFHGHGHAALSLLSLSRFLFGWCLQHKASQVGASLLLCWRTGLSASRGPEEVIYGIVMATRNWPDCLKKYGPDSLISQQDMPFRR